MTLIESAWRTVMLAALLSAGAVAQEPAPAAKPIDMGKQSLDPTAFSKWRKAGLAVREGEDTPEMAGVIVNGTGVILEGLTVFVSNVGRGKGAVPEAVRVSVVTGKGRSDAAFEAVAGGRLAKVTFAKGAEPLAPDDVAAIKLEVADPGVKKPGVFRVALAPLLLDRPHGTGKAADHLDRFELGARRAALVRVSSTNWCDRAVLRVENVDRRRNLTDLTGKLRLPSGARVSSVRVLDPASGKPLRKARVTRESGGFGVSGLSLARGEACDVLVVYGAPPRDTVSLEIQATFSK